jgi:hypothetical protein
MTFTAFRLKTRLKFCIMPGCTLPPFRKLDYCDNHAIKFGLIGGGTPPDEQQYA